MSTLESRITAKQRAKMRQEEFDALPLSYALRIAYHDMLEVEKDPTIDINLAYFLLRKDNEPATFRLIYGRNSQYNKAMCLAGCAVEKSVVLDDFLKGNLCNISRIAMQSPSFGDPVIDKVVMRAKQAYPEPFTVGPRHIYDGFKLYIEEVIDGLCEAGL